MGPVRERADDGGACARAYAAIQRALALAAAHAERARNRRSSARWSVRYVQGFDPAAAAERDRAYAGAMERVAAAAPHDLDVATLYAEGLFLLLPRPRRVCRREATVARVLGDPRGRAAARSAAPRRVPSLHTYDRADGGAPTGRGVRGAPRGCHPGCQPHQPHAGAHLDADGPMGRRGAMRAFTRGNPIRKRRGYGRGSPTPRTTCRC